MNSFGTVFKVHIFGESHGALVGVNIDGVPAGITLYTEDFINDLRRRQGGKKGGTPRKEEDMPDIVTGIYQNKTTGAPLTVLFKNLNIRSEDYIAFKEIPRPGHADFVAKKKFANYNDPRGGGHFSGRLTLALVAAGVLAKKIIAPIKISAKLTEAGGITDIEKAVEQALQEKESIGGIVICEAENLPVGLGEPFFNSIESLLSHAVFAIPAVKGIAFGSGFSAAEMKGSVHNDLIINEKGTTKTNYAGGINGGVTNGNILYFKVAVKPTSSISKVQETFSNSAQSVVPLQVEGRHDTCIALRVPVVVEAVTAIVLADLLFLAQERKRVV